MLITCPSCHTSYEVPASRLGSVPTTARCARCKREFTVLPPDGPEPPAPAAFGPVVIPPPPEPPPPAPANLAPPIPAENPFRPAPEAGPPPPPERQRGGATSRESMPRGAMSRGAMDRGAMIGWTASLVGLVTLVLLAILFRAGIMAAWPPSQRLFHLFGSH